MLSRGTDAKGSDPSLEKLREVYEEIVDFIRTGRSVKRGNELVAVLISRHIKEKNMADNKGGKDAMK